jgi:polar amino acid transport system permease protein
VGTNWQPIFDHLQEFLQGTLLTIEVSVVAFVLAFLIGLVGAAGRRSDRWVPRAAAGVFVEVIRNTPVLLPTSRRSSGRESRRCLVASGRPGRCWR